VEEVGKVAEIAERMQRTRSAPDAHILVDVLCLWISLKVLMSMKVRGGEKLVTRLIDGQMMFNGATRLSRADVISSWKKNVEALPAFSTPPKSKSHLFSLLEKHSADRRHIPFVRFL
jgi:hypothetical protein